MNKTEQQADDLMSLIRLFIIIFSIIGCSYVLYNSSHTNKELEKLAVQDNVIEDIYINKSVDKVLFIKQDKINYMVTINQYSYEIDKDEWIDLKDNQEISYKVFEDKLYIQ